MKLILGSLLMLSILAGTQAFAEEYIITMSSSPNDKDCEDKGTCFDPRILEINVGDTVRWVENGYPYSVIVLDDTKDLVFNMHTYKGDNSFQFDKEGKYEYRHQQGLWKKGIILVDVEQIQNEGLEYEGLEYEGLEYEGLEYEGETLESESVQFDSALVQSKEIPGWVKGVAGFWADGKISDEEFKEALIFLINNGVIVL